MINLIDVPRKLSFNINYTIMRYLKYIIKYEKNDINLVLNDNKS